MLLLIMNIFATIFEVMDKEPTALQNYLFFVSLGVTAFLLIRYRFWLALVVLPILLFFVWIHVSELNHPFIGVDIVREAGYDYVVHSYVAMTIAVVLSLAGVLTEWRRKTLPQPLAPMNLV
jgi:hypothetical protein